jgi:hypothetical protein
LLEAYTRDTPLILVLEDLHWGDPSSIALALDLARRSEFARVLVIATFRPSGTAEGLEVLRTGAHALHVRGQADEIALSPLATEDVAQYLERRFALGDAATRELAPRLHARTDGNALFLVTLANAWIERGLLVRDGARFALAVSTDALLADLPDTLRETLAHEIERHSRPELVLLEAASAIGVGFSAALVAAGTGCTVDEVERYLDAIARREGMLHATGRELLPDGSHSERYAFRHELVREALHARLEGAWRIEVNRRIGVALENAFGARASEIATDLARHFDAAEDPLRAARWYEEAARVANGRFAYQEAESLIRHALTRLECAPPGAERDERELRLRLARMTPLLATRGYGSAEVENNSCLAERLVAASGSVAAKVLALGGLWSFRLIRGELAAAEDIARRSVELADRDTQQELRTIARLRLGTIHLYRGDLVGARGSFAWVVDSYDPDRDCMHPFYEDLDPGVTALAYLGWVLWLQGDDASARVHSNEALALAHRLRRPHSEALALCTRAGLDGWRDDPASTLADAEAALDLSARHGFMQWLTFALRCAAGPALVRRRRARDRGARTRDRRLPRGRRAALRALLPRARDRGADARRSRQRRASGAGRGARDRARHRRALFRVGARALERRARARDWRLHFGALFRALPRSRLRRMRSAHSAERRAPRAWQGRPVRMSRAPFALALLRFSRSLPPPRRRAT